MIKVYFSPQRADNQIEYSFCGETVTARIGEAENTFDFSALPDGELNKEDDESIETTLPVCPVISAKRINGILHLELLNWLGPDAPYESRFPEWVELPLPKGAVKKEGSKHNAVIPWRTKQEIEAEKAVRLAAEQERQERRARIREGLTTAKTEAELRSILQDMAREMGII